jgi:hypothetical protein
LPIVFRAVSLAQAEQIRRTGSFETVPQGCEGKHFADTIESARKFGDRLFGGTGYRIVEAEVPDDSPSQYRWPNLDECGSARYLAIEDLSGVQPRIVWEDAT